MRDVGEEREAKTRVTGNLQRVDVQALRMGSQIEGRSEGTTKGRPGAHFDLDGSIFGQFWGCFWSLEGRFWLPKVGRKRGREESPEKVAKRPPARIDLSISWAQGSLGNKVPITN